MTVNALGAITTVGPVVPVPTKCCSVLIQALPANTGHVYVKAGGNVIQALAAGQVFSLQSQTDSELIFAEQYSIGAENSGEGAYVTLWS